MPETAHHILTYLQQEYQPLSVIAYGSYADGSHNADSDFDALVITESHEVFHDVSFVEGIQLDVFVYPAPFFAGDFDCGDFVQIFDGKILIDRDGTGAALQNRVLSYLQKLPQKSEEEVRGEIEWCRKMLLRAKRGDAEGFFRWHWLLTDSLEIFCGAAGHPYRGPKKALRWLAGYDPEGFARYQAALSGFRREDLEAWVSYLEQTGSQQQPH